MVAKIYVMVFWVMAVFSPVGAYQHFGAIFASILRLPYRWGWCVSPKYLYTVLRYVVPQHRRPQYKLHFFFLVASF
jgi:hypothetical protein